MTLENFLSLVFVACLCFAPAAQANPDDNLFQRVAQEAQDQYRQCQPNCSSSCSPEVKNKNIDILDLTLVQLAKSSDFKNELRFQNFVSETIRLPSVDAQIAAYGSAIGLNRKGESVSAQALYEFLGARDYSKYMKTAEKNLGLQPEHANTMVHAIAKDLLGSEN